MCLWSKENEIEFFESSIEKFATLEQLFYVHKGDHLAYIPKKNKPNGMTVNSRNSLIGKFTENWCKRLFEPIAKSFNLYAVNGVLCDELGLNGQSPADMAFCKTNSIQQTADSIKCIFEIKMSIISNYKYNSNKTIECIGDFKSHIGTPSLLRSDSMLKAIGKAINIKVSGDAAATIPIIVIGNSPITDHYVHKVDYLKYSGIIQGFWSLYPNPITADFIKETEGKGFITINNSQELEPLCRQLIETNMSYFSSMLPKESIGEIIRIASLESTDIEKAEKFLKLIKG